MAFMIHTRDRANSASVRNAHRADHYAYLQAHAALLIASGGLQDDDGSFSGGLIVLDVATKEEAEVFAANDPFTRAGLFEEVVITRWVQAFLNGKEIRQP